jgi:hypothetical protein
VLTKEDVGKGGGGLASQIVSKAAEVRDSEVDIIADEDL